MYNVGPISRPIFMKFKVHLEAEGALEGLSIPLVIRRKL
jgi:hypothetical protein